MINVGQKVRFDPSILLEGTGAKANKGTKVTATVAFVNKQNGWFSAEYIMNGVKQRATFWFDDIGEGAVILCGK